MAKGNSHPAGGRGCSSQQLRRGMKQSTGRRGGSEGVQWQEVPAGHDRCLTWLLPVSEHC